MNLFNFVLRCFNRKKRQDRKVRVGLIIDEFFGGAGTGYGGYGILARNYISKYIPNDDIEIDVLLGRGGKYFVAQKYREDSVDLYRLPRRGLAARIFLGYKNYDVYLSIELTYDFVLRMDPNTKRKLILWIQDPRPMYEWDEINTVELFPEPSYYNQRIYDTVHDWSANGRIRFISQGHFLNTKAIDLYRLPTNTPIQYLPNPVEIDYSFDITKYEKKNQIIFLGRVESVKRGWLFCEIAKLMPEYDFFVLGQTLQGKEKISKIMAPYKNIQNLHFMGHVDGEEKKQFLKDSKILINTSIHEALPVSFLEALSYGTLLVSNRNPEDLTSKFGVWTGDVIGDGFDKIDLYVDAVRKIMNDENLRIHLATSAIEYIKQVHNIPRFIKDLRHVILRTTNND